MARYDSSLVRIVDPHLVGSRAVADTATAPVPINAGADNYKLDLGDVPPSPSTVSGQRIYRAPSFTHWPPLMYYGERRNIAFSIETKPGEKTGTIHWLGSDPIPLRFESPLGGNEFSGLLDLPDVAGTHTAQVTVGDREFKLFVRIVDIADEWPHDHLVRFSGNKMPCRWWFARHA